MSRAVLITAGEASGDLYGADLALTLQTRLPNVRLYGVGGARMQQAGVTLLADSRTWGAIGIVESLKVAPRIYAAFRRVKQFLRQQRPDLFIPIDFGAFNMPLCCYAKRLGVRVMYYIPPSSWRRERQGSDLPRCTNQVLTPFAWSAELLRTMGAQAHWIPHPLLRLARPTETKAAFCERLGLDPLRPIVALLPGSRRHEVHALTPLYARVAETVYATAPETQFVLSVAPHLSPDALHALWADGSRQWVPTETNA
ncbi:MAG: hypothetical protein NZ556_06530, partial [Fimbriimonadales bacterium]|nr:hypothetical protein [Fimbriimonadales bacterium]